MRIPFPGTAPAAIRIPEDGTVPPGLTGHDKAPGPSALNVTVPLGPLILEDYQATYSVNRGAGVQGA